MPFIPLLLNNVEMQVITKLAGILQLGYYLQENLHRFTDTWLEFNNPAFYSNVIHHSSL